jgi:hypothetical protein
MYDNRSLRFTLTPLNSTNMSIYHLPPLCYINADFPALFFSEIHAKEAYFTANNAINYSTCVKCVTNLDLMLKNIGITLSLSKTLRNDLQM